MKEYTVTRAGQVDLSALAALLAQHGIPHSESHDGNARLVRIGPDDDLEVRQSSARLGRKKTSVSVRYEHPVLKNVLTGWLERCGAEVDDEFYKWHFGLSPSILAGIKARWRVDLSGLKATPAKLGQIVLVFMFDTNVTSVLASQLAGLPHRQLSSDEFIECSDFTVKGDDPFDTIVYGWRSDAGSQLFVVTASAPATTLLSLWVIAEGAPASHNITNLPNQAL